jgi:NADH-quinone oxidoreductase subunit M
MFNHGCITAMLFLIVGVLYDRAHHRDLNGFGGVASVTPVYAGLTSLAFFASMGLPGLSGFISEVLVFIGAFPKWPVLTIIAVGGIIITAGYLLWTVQRVFFGPTNPKYAELPDINGRELFMLVPLAAIVIFLGLWPHPVLGLMNNSLTFLGDLVMKAGRPL